MFAFITITIAALLAGILMLATHYVAPRIAGRDLHPVEAYVAGCLLGLLFPFAGWALFWLAFAQPHMAAWLPPVALLAIVVGAGLGTVAAYALDLWHGHRVREAIER